MALFHFAEVFLAATLSYQALRLASAVPPAAPFNVLIGNTVLAVAQVNDEGAVTVVRVMQGVTPFTDEVVKAVRQWHFDPAHLDGHAVASQVGVMFRPHAFGNAGLGGPTFGFTPPEVPPGDHPVLPRVMFDPGWPVTALSEIRRLRHLHCFDSEFYAGIAHHPVATYRFCRFRGRRRNFTRHTGRVCLACNVGA